MVSDAVGPEELRERFGLQPLPVEGGWFRETWRAEEDDTGRPLGTAIVVLLSTAADGFSAMHRLPTDEIWLFHGGDPIEMLLLDEADGSHRTVLLGDPAAGLTPQFVVAAGTWMGAAPKGDRGWSMFGCTVTPGFLAEDYEGGVREELAERFPEAADHIARLTRPGEATSMTGGS